MRTIALAATSLAQTGSLLGTSSPCVCLALQGVTKEVRSVGMYDHYENPITERDTKCDTRQCFDAPFWTVVVSEVAADLIGQYENLPAETTDIVKALPAGAATRSLIPVGDDDIVMATRIPIQKMGDVGEIAPVDKLNSETSAGERGLAGLCIGAGCDEKSDIPIQPFGKIGDLTDVAGERGLAGLCIGSGCDEKSDIPIQPFGKVGDITVAAGERGLAGLCIGSGCDEKADIPIQPFGKLSEQQTLEINRSLKEVAELTVAVKTVDGVVNVPVSDVAYISYMVRSGKVVSENITPDVFSMLVKAKVDDMVSDLSAVTMSDLLINNFNAQITQSRGIFEGYVTVVENPSVESDPETTLPEDDESFPTILVVSSAAGLAVLAAGGLGAYAYTQNKEPSEYDSPDVSDDQPKVLEVEL